MFNMKNVGMRISELRKARNMTQMELADKMAISFQAVSNWERGSSMPDIAKLPELAQLFGVTVDEILGEKSGLIDSAASGTIDEYLTSSAVTPKQLSDAAPILKPKQVNTIFQRTQVNSLKDVIELLPYLDQDTVDQLAQKAADTGDQGSLTGILPFASQSVIDGIASQMTGEGKSIAELAPFMSCEALGDVAEAIWEKQGLLPMTEIAMFLPQDQIDKIAQQEYAQHGLKQIDSIAPFLSSECLNALAKQVIQTGQIKDLSPIMMYLDSDTLDEQVKKRYL